MKYPIALVLLMVLSGCSTLGQIEAMNDLGNIGRTVGEMSRMIDSSCKRMNGRSCDISPAEFNRMYGEAQQLPYYALRK